MRCQPSAVPKGRRGHATPRSPPKGGLSCFQTPKFLLYADEFGHDGIWDPNDPRHNHHPLFGLAGFVLPMERWRDLDRVYLKLKRSFYAWEIERAALEGKRSERFEAKTLTSARDFRFTVAVLQLIRELGGHGFVHGRCKPVGGPHDSDALYGSVTQGLMLAFENYIRKHAGTRGRGMMVIDRRTEDRDVQLLSSAQSFLFSAQGDVRGGFERLVEVPMLVRSEWHHGVQAADTLARAVGRVFRFRAAHDVTHQKFNTKLGQALDELAVTLGSKSTFYVRPVGARRVDS